MNKKIVILSLLVLANLHALAWGRWGHQHINKAAVMALPTDMGLFFYDHADFMVEESIVPDIRKYLMGDKTEGPRHFIDLEEYRYTTPANMPASMAQATERFGKDSIQRAGILPWYIEDMMVKLTKAFKDKNKTEILLIAADLGHYIADAQMPLHTSSNHDGQLTGQQGIHAFWESQLPEMFGDGYNLHTIAPEYITDVSAYVWDFIARSHKLADTMLLADRTLRTQYHDSDMYARNAQGVTIKTAYGSPVRSKEYATAYHKALNGMVEIQMRNAVNAASSMWYTAWVNAGKPKLDNMETKQTIERNKKYYNEDLAEWKKGKVSGFMVNKEY